MRDVCSNFGAFAAIKDDGTVVAWGAQAAEALQYKAKFRRDAAAFLGDAACGGDTFAIDSDLRNVQPLGVAHVITTIAGIPLV